MAMLLVLMGFAVAVFGYALSFPGSSNFRSGKWMPGPAFIPQMLAIILFVAAAIELVRLIRHRRLSPDRASANGVEPGATPARSALAVKLGNWGTQNAIIILLLMFSVPFLVERVGFAIMGFSVVFVVTWCLKAGLIKSAVFAALAVTATMFFFRLVFFMDLPPGIWSPTQYLGY